MAFFECGNLAAITVPGSVKVIEYNAFSQCTNLTTATLEEGVITIKEWAFGGCNNLQTVIIPSSVTEVKTNAFVGCTKNDLTLYVNQTVSNLFEQSGISNLSNHVRWNSTGPSST